MSAMEIVRYLYFIPPVIVLFLAFYAWPKRKVPTVQPFIGLMMGLFFYTFAFAMSHFVSTVAALRLWDRVMYVGLATVPSFALVLALVFSNREYWSHRLVRTVLVAIPFLTLALNYSTELHGLYYASLGLAPEGSASRLLFSPGPWYHVHMGYINMAAVVGFLFYAEMLLNAAATRYRNRSLLMMGGVLFPWGAYLISQSGWAPTGLDIVPYASAIAGLLYAAGLFGFGTLDLIPIARERVFDAIAEGVIVFDTRHRLLDFNAAARSILPALDKAPIGASMSEVLTVFPTLATQIIDGVPGVDIELQSGGRTRYFYAYYAPITNRFGTRIGGTLMLADITDRELLMRSLEQISVVDALTGLSNRRSLMAHIDREISRAKRHKRPLSLIMLDIDHFKQVNDRWGHLAGDEVLRAVSDACRDAVREHDLVGRYGGEEIVVVLPEAQIDDAVIIAERIRQKIGEISVRYGDDHISVTASSGAASLDMLPEEKRTTDRFIEVTDRAMYRAKAEGRNCVRRAG